MKLLSFFLFFSPLLFSQTFVYECSNNKTFTIEIKEDKAWLFTQDISQPLLHVTSASGTKYEASGLMFWSHGYEAMLDTPSNTYRKCTNNRYKAVWEDAKLRGNDFRALGNEPGWYLEIAESGKKTLLVTDYGNEKYELQLPKPFTSQSQRSTRYRIKGFLDILIEDKKCLDSMSGHKFESRVTVKINGKTYKGCGKALH